MKMTFVEMTNSPHPMAMKMNFKLKIAKRISDD